MPFKLPEFPAANRLYSLRALSVSLFSALVFTLAVWLGACSLSQESTPAITPSQVAGPTSSPTKGPTSEATESIAPTRAIEIPAESVRGASVTFWHPWSGLLDPSIQQLIEKFNDQNPYGITVVPQAFEDLEDSMRAALDADSPPDLAVGLNYHAMAWDRGGSTIVDLTSYFYDPEFGYTETEQDDFYQSFFEADNQQGKQLTLPLFRTAEVLLYNTTWAQELGFSEAPGNLEDLKEQACAAAASSREDSNPGNDQEGGLMLTYEPGGLLSWIYAFGGSILPGESGGSYGLDDPQTIEAFNYTRLLLNEGCAWTPEDRFPNEAFAARRGLFLQSTLSGWAYQQAAMEAAGNSDNWQMIAYPSKMDLPASLVSGPGFVLFASSQEQQLAAWLFVKWFMEPERLAGWAEESETFPTRSSSLAEVIQEEVPLDRWENSREIVLGGVPLPPIASWSAVQWVLGDAARVLYAPLTSADDVPSLVNEMDMLAEEVDGFFR